MKETERGNGNRNQDDNIQSVSSQVFPVPVTGRSCLKTATNIAHLQIHQTMYPNDSLDSDEDEIAVHTTYKVYLLKYFQSQSQAESV